MKHIVVSTALLFAVTFGSVALAADTPAAKTPTAAKSDAKTDADREKKELRLVEILKTMQKKPPPPPAEQKKLGDEYQSLLMYFGGIDPKNPPKDPAEGQKAMDRAMAAQGEILQRRDPALGAELVKELKLYQCKTKQTEAKATLRGVFAAEKSYQAENDKFSSDMNAIGAMLENKRYKTQVIKADAKTFLARASGQNEMAGDVWEVDDSGIPKAVTDLCAK